MSKKAKRILALLKDPRYKNKLMERINRSTLDEGVAPLGNGEMIILKDIESLDLEHDQHIQDIGPKATGN